MSFRRRHRPPPVEEKVEEEPEEPPPRLESGRRPSSLAQLELALSPGSGGGAFRRHCRGYRGPADG
ncbi:MAG: hypothetical protein Q9Q13_07675, partial [Acidobacteriota bacterium]|nr:hypothetical protein [Acidobacteriota bacterium]